MNTNSNPTNPLSSPGTSRAALKRLLIILAFSLAVGIYAYGWTVTNIDLSTPQEPTRQQNVTNALQELLSPRIFEQDVIPVTSTADFLVDCDEGDAPPVVSAPPEAGQPYIVVEPTCGVEGDIVSVTAYNFAAGVNGEIRWVPLEGQSRPRTVLETGTQGFAFNPDGSFTATIEVPRIGGSTGEVHRVGVLANVPDGPVHFSEISNEVVRRMIETIFMALLATSIAIPIAAVLSFFAARNLMRNIRLPFGNLAMNVIALPVGWLLGMFVLAPIGNFALTLANGETFGPAITLLVFPIFMTLVYVLVGLLRPPVTGETSKIRGIVNLVIMVAVVMFGIGLLGGEGLFARASGDVIAEQIRPENTDTLINWLGNAFADGVYGMGYMLGVLGGLVELFMVPIAGILGIFTFATLSGRTITPVLNAASGPIAHILGGILGGIMGAILMVIIAEIGRSAALLGLLTPVVPALLMGQIATFILRKYIYDPPYPNAGQRMVRNLVYFVFAAAMYIYIFILLDIGGTLVTGVLPSGEVTQLGFLPAYDFTVMIIGAILAAIYGLLSGTRANFLLGDFLYNTTRTVLNALRSIEPLIMGLIFVVWVGIGPFAGVMALTLHSIAALGKLYSEQIENIDEGPIEALKSTGANQLQTIIYAVVPQIIPPYIAFTMYRWDINVRMSTIIGFVGGGGIGLLLNQQINLLRYRDAGVAVLAIAIVVSILDYASASIRERVI